MKFDEELSSWFNSSKERANHEIHASFWRWLPLVFQGLEG